MDQPKRKRPTGQATERAMIQLLNNVLEQRGRFAWYEALGDLSLLRVPHSVTQAWADLSALDRAHRLCAALARCRTRLQDTAGVRYYAALADPPSVTYGNLAQALRQTTDALTAARETRQPLSPPASFRRSGHARPRQRRRR